MNTKDINTEETNDLMNEDNQCENIEDLSKKGKKSCKSKDSKLKTELESLKNDNEELKDKYLRLVAEYDNYRKRTSKEKVEIRENVKSSIISDFLPVIDDIDRAVQYIDTAKDLEATKEGILLINNKFHDFLKSEGISEIESIGEDFDIDLHEAITKFPTQDESQKGKVIDVIQKGYKLGDKVVRFAKVVVGE